MQADMREQQQQQRHPDLGPRDPRVFFAAERTTLAWLRTGITLMGFGFVVARFGLFLHELASIRSGPTSAPVANGPRLSLWAGVALMALGIWINLGATVRHFRFRNRFERGEPFITPRGMMLLVLAAVLAALGIGLVTYLVIIGL